MEQQKSIKTIQSVNRALDILDVLNNNSEPVSLAGLSKILLLNKTTVYHLIKTLEFRNFVAFDPKTNRYRLGLKLFELGHAVAEHSDVVVQAVLPYMRKIRDKYDETVHLGILEEYQGQIRAVYIEKIETTRYLRIHSRIGWPIPLYCTALGKMFLSQFSFDYMSNILGSGELKRYTPNTLIDKLILYKELELSSKRGWFFDNIEFQPGVKCIAVPVRNRLNIVAGVSISMPADRLTDEKKDSIIADMLELSHKLSMEIGGAANNNLL